MLHPRLNTLPIWYQNQPIRAFCFITRNSGRFKDRRDSGCNQGPTDDFIDRRMTAAPSGTFLQANRGVRIGQSECRISMDGVDRLELEDRLRTIYVAIHFPVEYQETGREAR